MVSRCCLVSDGRNDKVVCELLPGSDLAESAALIARTWGVRVERNVQLDTPLAVLLRELVDANPLQQRAALMRLCDISRPRT